MRFTEATSIKITDQDSLDVFEFSEALIQLMASSEQGYALFDSTDRLKFANSVFRRFLDVAEGTFPTWPELMRAAYKNSTGTRVETDDFETWLRSAQARRGKLPYRTIETELHDGRWIFISETTLLGGWMLCVMTDISELGSNSRVLRQQLDSAVKSSYSDELTGLSNRRYLMNRLKEKICPSIKSPIASVAILDIDHFKSVNDKYGHDFGDQVLKHFGGVLQHAVGRDDLSGRLGGEEFLIATDSRDPRVLELILERAYHALQQGGAFPDEPDFSYNFSCGIAVALTGETASETMKRADLALYKAKATGRGRTCIADPTPT
jgi:diguanylate cyclase (GGDEF)-like protein